MRHQSNTAIHQYRSTYTDSYIYHKLENLEIVQQRHPWAAIRGGRLRIKNFHKNQHKFYRKWSLPLIHSKFTTRQNKATRSATPTGMF